MTSRFANILYFSKNNPYGMLLFKHLGRYYLLMLRVFRRPEKRKVFYGQLIEEMQHIGVNSLGIVAFISVFMGAVVAIQTAFSIDSPLIPKWTIGYTSRQSIILEFSPTIICLILAGKVGSRIASEIGTMRVTEQIDALDIMGVNSANFLIQPKVIASVLIYPMLVILSMFLGIFGGWFALLTTGISSSTYFLAGLRLDFAVYDVFYSLVKTVVFAFVTASISGYCGYTVKGGAIEVGAASTRAVVYSSMFIIFFNLVLTQLLLS